MPFDYLGAPLLAIVAGAIAIVLLTTGISALDRLDRGGVPRRSSEELFTGQSRLRRFAGWMLWAAPAVIVACGVAGALWGSIGATIAGVAAFVNMAGIAWVLHETPLGPNGRRAFIVLGWLQIPVGIARLTAEGI